MTARARVQRKYGQPRIQYSYLGTNDVTMAGSRLKLELANLF